MIHKSLKYYQDKHYKAIANSKTFLELSAIAIEILNTMPQPIIEVCGPTSTGGAGSLQKNLEIIEKTTYKLSDKGHNVFNWVPFDKQFQIIKNNTAIADAKEKNLVLLEGFYGAIFRSGHIKKCFFIHGWESSHGANWERKILKELNIEIEDLPKDFLEK